MYKKLTRIDGGFYSENEGGKIMWQQRVVFEKFQLKFSKKNWKTDAITGEHQ